MPSKKRNDACIRFLISRYCIIVWEFNFLVLHYCLRVLSLKNLSAEVKFVQINIVFFRIFSDCFGIPNLLWTMRLMFINIDRLNEYVTAATVLKTQCSDFVLWIVERETRVYDGFTHSRINKLKCMYIFTC